MPNASMRPRVFPAEDGETLNKACAALEASMRPRVFPAEDAIHSLARSGRRLLQ